MSIHPYQTGLDQLKDAEIETKIKELSKRYFQTHNPQLQQQITMLLDGYKDEMQQRRLKQADQMSKSNKGLDKLINVD